MWRCKLTVAFVLVFSASMCLAAGPEYTITNLGALPGNNLWGFQLWGINNQGQVVGDHSGPDGNVRAYLWTAAGGMQDLAGPGVSYSVAYSINDSGQVAGYTKSGAALWTIGGGVQTLAGPGSFAPSVNRSGQVVGGFPVGSVFHTFLWTASGGIQDMASTIGLADSYALGINNSGEVLVSSGRQNYLWSAGGGLQDLGILPGQSSCLPRGLNDSGHVVGFTLGNGSDGHAFLWTPSGGMQDLGTLGGPQVAAHGINDSDEVVGWATNSHQTLAFRWTPENGMQDLNGLIDSNSHWTLIHADVVNDVGQIAGIGADPSGLFSVFLLTPVPEPATLALLAIGGLTIFRRRKR